MSNTQQMIVQFTDDERVRIRHHLGYLNVAAVSTYNLGVPAMQQTQFMVEGAMQAVLMPAYEKVKQFLCRMDDVEQEIYCGKDLASVNSIAEINVNRDRVKELVQMYRIAQQGLANLLGIVPNPFDQRELFRSATFNAPVRN